MWISLVSSSIALVCFFSNFLLFWKILVRPSIHSLFNISIAVNLLLCSISSPFLVSYYTQVYQSSDTVVSKTANNISWSATMYLDQNDRQYSCFIFYSVRSLIVCSTAVCFFNNIMFRYLQIMYSGRGLVIKGKINTDMMGALYFLWEISLSSFLILIYSGVYYIQYDQPHNFITGRICNRIQLNYSTQKEYNKYFRRPLFIMLANALVPCCFVLYFKFNTEKLMKTLCPTGKSSSALGGNHRRNLLTFHDCIGWLFNYEAFNIGQVVMFSIIYNYKDQLQLSTEIIFQISFLYTSIFDMYRCFYSPIKWIWRSRMSYLNIWVDEDVDNYAVRLRRRPFYVRLDILPRRDIVNLRKGEIYKMYPYTALETIFEERPETEEATDMFICSNTTKHWRNTLKKVPTNGKLYIRKKVVPRYKIPAELDGVPGWQPSTYETRLENCEVAHNWQTRMENAEIATKTQQLNPLRESLWLEGFNTPNMEGELFQDQLEMSLINPEPCTSDTSRSPEIWITEIKSSPERWRTEAISDKQSHLQTDTLTVSAEYLFHDNPRPGCSHWS